MRRKPSPKTLRKRLMSKARKARVRDFYRMRQQYRNWLTGPEWAEIRADFARLEPPKCAACGAEANQSLHHLQYADPPKDTPYSDMMWLCREPCHVIADHLRREKLVAPKRDDVVRAIRRRLTPSIQPPIPHPLDRLK